MKKASNNIPSDEKSAILSLLRNIAAADTEIEYQRRVAVLQSSDLYKGAAKERLRQFVSRIEVSPYSISLAFLQLRITIVLLATKQNLSYKYTIS